MNSYWIYIKVDKYKRFKLITCIWYALAVIGFSGEFSNYFFKIGNSNPHWLDVTLKRWTCLVESINLKAFKAFASVLHLGNYTAFIIVAALYGPCQMGLTPVMVVDFNIYIYLQFVIYDFIYR